MGTFDTGGVRWGKGGKGQGERKGKRGVRGIRGMCVGEGYEGIGVIESFLKKEVVA